MTAPGLFPHALLALTPRVNKMCEKTLNNFECAISTNTKSDNRYRERRRVMTSLQSTQVRLQAESMCVCVCVHVEDREGGRERGFECNISAVRKTSSSAVPFRCLLHHYRCLFSMKFISTSEKTEHKWSCFGANAWFNTKHWKLQNLHENNKVCFVEI